MPFGCFFGAGLREVIRSRLEVSLLDCSMPGDTPICATSVGEELWTTPGMRTAARVVKGADTAGANRNIAITAMQGMGGIGKTVLVEALCHDEVVQQAFPDGIFWFSIGKSGAPGLDHSASRAAARTLTVERIA